MVFEVWHSKSFLYWVFIGLCRRVDTQYTIKTLLSLKFQRIERHPDKYAGHNSKCFWSKQTYQRPLSVYLCFIIRDFLLPCSWLLIKELPDSRMSSAKRQVTPFLYIGSQFICPPYWRASVWELLQNYKIILKYHQYSGEFFLKKYVCTHTRTHIVLIAQ